jgi:hypothetical protein
MKITILTILSFCLCSSLFAQSNFAVNGAVGDTAAHSTLKNTSISVLNAKDSTLRRFTRAGSDGSFAINKLAKGKFILLITYPGYADYVENFALDSAKSTHSFGKINMILKAKLLADVIIKGTRAAIKMKGDTTEYNAAAFKIQPNSKVEDLLKQLPGITVDKDGKITAQGQTVSKVLVDGEEFFGDDPTLVTKNIRGDMVDKVQLYYKKSDQATFTGIDDGVKTKTLNIKLKDDKKNGYFGKAEAGDGNGYYQGQLLFNKFAGKKKFSAYGTVGNNGKTGLGWQDSQKYGASDNLQFGDNGEIFIFGGGNDGLDSFSGQYDGRGLPLARTGGVHYDTKWDNDKKSLNANYKIGSLTVDGTSTDLSQNSTAQEASYTSSGQKFHNYMFRQKLDAMYQVKLDTTSNLKVSADGTLKNTNINNAYNSEVRRQDSSLVNKGTRNVVNNGNTKIFNASAFYTKKFRKKGRTFSLNVAEAYNNMDTKGYLNSETHYYNAAGVKDSLVNQYKTTSITDSKLNSNATYTEPLSKDFSVIVNYGFSLDNGKSERLSYNQTAPGIYTSLDSKFSNSYQLNQVLNQVGGIFNYKKDKSVFNFGTKVSGVNFKQTDEFTQIVLKRNFINWNPQAMYQYRFSQQQSLRFNYWGNTTQPNINQIQPVVDNSDPVNRTIGNPNLKPSFVNRFNLGYNSYKVLSGQSIWLYGNYSYTSNPIVNNTTYDFTSGNTVTQYVNLNKKPVNFYGSVYLDRKITKGNFNIGLNFNANGSVNYSLSNGDVNRTRYNTYTAELRLSKYKEKKYEFNFSVGPNYTFSGSSLTPQINNNGRGFTSNDSFTLYLPGKFQVASDVSYEFRAKTQTFNQDFKRTLLNASLIKTFLKQDNLKVTLLVNDLLNQNVGFSRNVNGNYITQSNYTTIKRYFMFTIDYDFSGFGGGVKK